jgi:hypothetical protein
MSPNKIDAVGYATARNTFEAAVDNRAFGRARNALDAAFVDNSAYGGARATLDATCVDNRIDGRGTGVKKFIATGMVVSVTMPAAKTFSLPPLIVVPMPVSPTLRTPPWLRIVKRAFPPGLTFSTLFSLMIVPVAMPPLKTFRVSKAFKIRPV